MYFTFTSSLHVHVTLAIYNLMLLTYLLTHTTVTVSFWPWRNGQTLSLSSLLTCGVGRTSKDQVVVAAGKSFCLDLPLPSPAHIRRGTQTDRDRQTNTSTESGPVTQFRLVNAFVLFQVYVYRITFTKAARGIWHADNKAIGAKRYVGVSIAGVWRCAGTPCPRGWRWLATETRNATWLRRIINIAPSRLYCRHTSTVYGFADSRSAASNAVRKSRNTCLRLQKIYLITKK